MIRTAAPGSYDKACESAAQVCRPSKVGPLRHEPRLRHCMTDDSLLPGMRIFLIHHTTTGVGCGTDATPDYGSLACDTSARASVSWSVPFSPTSLGSLTSLTACQRQFMTRAPLLFPRNRHRSNNRLAEHLECSNKAA